MAQTSVTAVRTCIVWACLISLAGAVRLAEPPAPFVPSAPVEPWHEVTEKHHPRSDLPDLSFLANKWLYFRGDSTTRQLVERLLTDAHFPLPNESFKGYVMKQCAKQEGREEPALELQRHTQCEEKQRTCNWIVPRLKLRVTFDWKHLVAEDREEYLYSRSKQADPHHEFYRGKMPDVLIVGAGVHPCHHSIKFETWSDAERCPDPSTTMQEFINQIPGLIKLKRSVYKGPIVWVEAGPYRFEAAEPKANRDAFHACEEKFNEKARLALKQDKNASVVPRFAIEKEWIGKHHEIVGIHRSEACVNKVFDAMLNSTRRLLGS